MEWLVAAASAFIVIVPVELPDKTFIATLVLGTRYRALPVWLGVCCAFFVQCAVAVGFGRLIALLPAQPVRIAAGLLFLVGAILLVRSARRDDTQAEAGEVEGRVAASRRAFGTSFLILFVAEWGDLSQLLTAGLVAAGRPLVPVFVGSFLALACVAALGVLLGRVLLRYIRLSVVRYVGAAICAILGVATLVSAFL